MDYKRLDTLQNDEIIKDDIIKKIEAIEFIIVELYQIIDDKEVQKILYENLTEIKFNLASDGLNLSLIYNRANIMHNLFNEFTTVNYQNSKRGMSQVGVFLKLNKYLHNILESSGINVDVLDHYTGCKYRVEKVIFSK